MSYKQAISVVMLLFLANNVDAQINKRMKRFIGTWEYREIRGFEVWSATGNELTGKAYRIKNEKDTVLIENMRITSENKKLVLYAQVIGQNEGKEIRFQESDKTKYLFVNNTHDFPKSIYYQFKFLRRKKVDVRLNHPHKDTHTKPLTLVRKK
jgi:hypothetical protein